MPTLPLAAGQSLCDGDHGVTLTFRDADGVRLCTDNKLTDLTLNTVPAGRAVFNDTSVATLGRLEIRNITTVGRVQILARDAVRAGHVDVDGLDIEAADATAETDGPHAYGVTIVQGAFTLWNDQPDEKAVVSADVRNVSAGRFARPVLGSGVFLSGNGERGGQLNVQRLDTAAVYSDGKLAPGTPDRISVGVLTGYGVRADSVHNLGPVMTYGVNDMALDNWGTVDRWTAAEKITTHGPSGIGFVNFGTIATLNVKAPIETFGSGARGYNVYDGTVRTADFDRIVTHGDGAVGVQISRPVGRLRVRRGIETFGGTGPSLVKGVVRNLSAVALSIKPGGAVETIAIKGGLRTHGAGIPPLEQEGKIDGLSVAGGYFAVEPAPVTPDAAPHAAK